MNVRIVDFGDGNDLGGSGWVGDVGIWDGDGEVESAVLVDAVWELRSREGDGCGPFAQFGSWGWFEGDGGVWEGVSGIGGVFF